MLKVLDLFSGIGGFTIAAELSDPDFFETIAYCEINEESRKCLEKRFPGVPIFEDVRTISATSILERCGELPDVICGGFPCQDISGAGKQVGLAGSRSGLFFEVVRLCSEIRPKYVFLENVANLLTIHNGEDFGVVLREMAEIRYDAEWDCLSAINANATHQRKRTWVLAYPCS